MHKNGDIIVVKEGKMINMTMTEFEKKIDNLENQYYKMVFVILKNYSIKTISNQLTNGVKLNINLKLSEKLLVIPLKDYYWHVTDFLLSFMEDDKAIYILDHIDILFDPLLAIQPINILESISRYRKIIVIWPGEYREGKLFYAEPQHSEYFNTKMTENLVITL